MTVGNVSTKIPEKKYVSLYSTIVPANNFATNASDKKYAHATKMVIPSIGIRDGPNLTSEYSYVETTLSASFGTRSAPLHYDVNVPIGETWYFDIEYLCVSYYNNLILFVKKFSGVATVSGGNNGDMNVQGGVRGYNSTATTYNHIILTKVTFNHVG